MNEDGADDRPASTLPLSQHLRVLQACDRFDAEWRSGSHPRIEDLVAQADSDDRRPLLQYLLALEVSLRRRAGEFPTPEEYYPRFPGLQDVVDAAFTDQTETAPDPDVATVEASARSEGDDDWGVLCRLMNEQHGHSRSVALADGILAWFRDRAKGLREILRERGFSVSPDAEGAAATGNDPGGQMPTLPFGHEPDARPGRTADGDAEPPERYQRGALQGRGGQADVYRAIDVELGRQVAVKALNEKYVGSRRASDRLWQEAEIIGRLQHPGIVPVYGRGRTANGAPYYAMRFIDEENLGHAIKRLHDPEQLIKNRRERALELRRMLRRFIDACEAVEYAHSRGVLHRDIKPGNIMLGGFGETLVIDWGLAKVMARPESPAREGVTGRRPPLRGFAPEMIDPTLVHQVLGTVGYMSPEQAERRWDELGPATDIYSLGATLYCLLVGTSPFPHQALSEFTIKVKRGEVSPAPREAKRYVHPALEAICLKAMALKPADRYPSAKALGEEIERWLDDEPLSCYVAPWPARAARWVRRHKPLVTAAAALLVTATVGLAISNVIISEKSDKARQAERRANVAKGKAEADRRGLEDSYKLINKVVIDIYIKFAGEGLVNIPQSEERRMALAATAVDIAGSLLQKRPQDPITRRTAAMCYWWAANVHRSRGRADLAAPYYQKALDVLDGIEDPPGTRPRWQFLSCQIAIDYARMLEHSGELSKAAERLREALVRVEGIESNSTDERFARARAQYSLGGALNRSAHAPEAEPLCKAAIATLADLIATPPKQHPYQLALVEALLTLGMVASEDPRSSGAMNAFNEALEHLKQLGTRRELTSDVRMLEAEVRQERGRLLADDPNRRAAALEDLDSAVASMADLAAQFAETSDYQAVLNEARLTRAELSVDDLARSGQVRLDAAAVKTALDPVSDRPLVREPLGRALGVLGLIALHEGDIPSARALLQRALDLQTAAAKEVPPGRLGKDRVKRLEEALSRIPARS